LPTFPGILTLRLDETPKERERSRRKPAPHWGRFFTWESYEYAALVPPAGPIDK